MRMSRKNRSCGEGEHCERSYPDERAVDINEAYRGGVLFAEEERRGGGVFRCIASREGATHAVRAFLPRVDACLPQHHQGLGLEQCCTVSGAYRPFVPWCLIAGLRCLTALHRGGKG